MPRENAKTPRALDTAPDSTGPVCSRWLAFSFVTLVCVALFVCRFLQPSYLMDKDQQRPASYVMDALRNGNWVVQRDASGDVMSKPPLSTWTRALAALPFDRINLLLLVLPSALATLGMVWLILAAGTVYFGRLAGFLASLCYILSKVGCDQIILVRTDPLFSLIVFAAALIAYRCWNGRGRWIWFWLAVAAGILTKGPLALVHSAGGLAAVFWERRSFSLPWRKKRLFLGLAIGLGPPLIWFALACMTLGTDVVRKMIVTELVGHAVLDDKGFPGSGFYNPMYYVVVRFVPWSLIGLWGFWRLVKSPSANDGERRFERFLFCHFVFGLAIFSLSVHHRFVHIWPLLPAVALIAGRTMAGWLRRRTMRTVLAGSLSMTALYFFSLYGFNLISPRFDQITSRTRRMSDFASAIRQTVGDGFPLIHVDSPYALQFFLNSYRTLASSEMAARALSSGHAAFAVVDDPEAMEARIGPETPLYRLYGPVKAKKEDSWLWVLGNRPRLEYTARMATLCGAVLVEMDGVHLLPSPLDDLTFWSRQPHGRLTLTNLGESALPIRIRVLNTRPNLDSEYEIAPRQRIALEIGAKKGSGETLRIGQLSDCRRSYAQLDWLAKTKAFAGLDYLFVNGDFIERLPWRFDRFLRQAARFKIPVYPICGNHDIVRGSIYGYEAFRNRLGYLRYCFDDGPARFVLLETAYKTIGDRQIDYLAESFGQKPSPERKIVFQHVPPGDLEDEPHFRGPKEGIEGILPSSETRPDGLSEKEWELAAAAGLNVDRIYCGHNNVHETVNHETPNGTVRVVVSGGGGEKSLKKSYWQHWLEMEISRDAITETPHGIEPPSGSARWAAEFRFGVSGLLRAHGGKAIVVLALGALLIFGGVATLRALRFPGHH